MNPTTEMRRFLLAERDVLCSKMMPCGKNSKGLNDTHSLRRIPALSGDNGVNKFEIPIIKESKSYTFTTFAPGSYVKPHSHDEGQLRIISRGSFDFVVGSQSFEGLTESDWLFIPEGTTYSIKTAEGGAIVTGYGMSCKCSGGGS